VPEELDAADRRGRHDGGEPVARAEDGIPGRHFFALVPLDGDQ
jgi:hypothetical protein